MEGHLIHCFWAFVADPFKLSLAIASFAIAGATIFAIKRYDLSVRQKVLAIYGHLAALFFPFVLFTFTMACSTALPCHWSTVAVNVVIMTALLTLAVGFIAIPLLYRHSARQIISGPLIDILAKHVKMFGLRMPKLYLIDRVKPLAFSVKTIFGSTIFLSIGLNELLTKKEKEAVILHELAHIKERSSILKFSSFVLRLFSPLSMIAQFKYDCSRDERAADRFVIEMQGTEKYLISAKRKIEIFGN